MMCVDILETIGDDLHEVALDVLDTECGHKLCLVTCTCGWLAASKDMGLAYRAFEIHMKVQSKKRARWQS